MIPDFQTVMLPFLQILSDKKEHLTRDIISAVSDKFNLTKEERNYLLPSGTSRVINNRVGWARTYLSKAGLIAQTRRGAYLITETGLELLRKQPGKVDVKMLSTYPAFEEWQRGYSGSGSVEIKSEQVIEQSESTPLEIIEEASIRIQDDLAFELLTKIKSCTADFFEQLVVDLVLKMGYGGSRKDAGEVTGKSGDGGIDGVIKEDKLGLERIYIQAKKWEGAVTITAVRDFAGSLSVHKARKGIMITTSTFPASAVEFAMRSEYRIVLIDGKKLAELMIEHNVGVATKEVFEVKKIDSDYFEEV
jgi:restriction system protein